MMYKTYITLWHKTPNFNTLHKPFVSLQRVLFTLNNTFSLKNQDHQHEIMTIKEYHQANLMLFNIKELKTTDTVLCTLTSIDRMSFLANGIEHHECKKAEINDYFIEVVKRNLILNFFNKIEIEKFDVLDSNINIDFLFE